MFFCSYLFNLVFYLCRMKLTAEVKAFIQEHIQDDPGQLLLAASRYPEIDVRFAAEQIAARRQIREKLPAWYQNPGLIFPSKLSSEQSSSEQTAIYKQQLVHPEWKGCDLTGGLGIDSWFLSQKARQIIYMERFPEYCRAAEHNFQVLGATNIRVINGDSMEQISTLPEKGVDFFYIDPARRAEDNKRTYALTACEPDLTRVLPLLFKKATKVIAKISPMADIRQTIQLLPGITEIHVLSVKNECKELLLVIEKEKEEITPLITTWNKRSDGTEEVFTFTLQEEENYPVDFAPEPQPYLYEPNTSLLKAGAFRTITRLGVSKLHPSSHLYTSGELIKDFPGRTFRIEEIIPFKGKEIKKLHTLIPQANITVRNFPLSVEELRKRTKIKEGGDTYLFATTLSNGEKVLIRCKRYY